MLSGRRYYFNHTFYKVFSFEIIVVEYSRCLHHFGCHKKLLIARSLKLFQSSEIELFNSNFKFTQKQGDKLHIKVSNQLKYTFCSRYRDCLTQFGTKFEFYLVYQSCSRTRIMVFLFFSYKVSLS